jgi:hypothetical protein
MLRPKSLTDWVHSAWIAAAAMKMTSSTASTGW